MEFLLTRVVAFCLCLLFWCRRSACVAAGLASISAFLVFAIIRHQSTGWSCSDTAFDI